MASEAIIEARQVEKFYSLDKANRIQVIAPTDLSIWPGEILALLGPSGSGKSTLLRMLTGLSAPSAGHVLMHGRPVGDARANVSIVFQSFALFPWLTVLENVAAPLKARGVDRKTRTERSLKVLDTVGLDGFENAYPKELSGGMRQRVGFARALVVEPEVLFMDEPFSALDVLTAENLRGELMELWDKRKMPVQAVFLVTHNIEEAVLLADRIVVLGKNPGRIRTDFHVVLPHPRERKDMPFTRIVDYVYRVLTQPELTPEPYKEHSAVGSRDGGKPNAYPMLPHARPGSVTGLLEMLADRGGREDIYRMAEELAFEIDDLLPIVESAALLGFLRVAEGDVEITLEGQSFAGADILTRKQLFQKACLERVPLLRQISRSLQAKTDHTLQDEFFRDLLDQHFTEEEASRQLDTAINWGRYAELFDYDAGAERFFIPDDAQSGSSRTGATSGT